MALALTSLRLIVSDGGGRTGARIGFGSRMMADMVDHIDGRLERRGGEPACGSW